jgi:hypothetical protein
VETQIRGVRLWHVSSAPRPASSVKACHSFSSPRRSFSRPEDPSIFSFPRLYSDPLQPLRAGGGHTRTPAGFVSRWARIGTYIVFMPVIASFIALWVSDAGDVISEGTRMHVGFLLSPNHLWQTAATSSGVPPWQRTHSPSGPFCRSGCSNAAVIASGEGSASRSSGGRVS